MAKSTNQSSGCVLITGATGLLGSQLLKLFITNSKVSIIVLGRGKSPLELAKRVCKILKNFDSKSKYNLSKFKRFKFVVGDIAKPNFAISKRDYRNLALNVEKIYHCAALTNFNAPKSELMIVNVEGTRNVLEFGKRCPMLKSIEYISSIYVVGKYTKSFSEDDVRKNQKFNNFYEYSKFRAEILVQKYISKGLRVNVYRPSVIVGESVNGRVINPGLLYQIFRLVKSGLVSVFPFDKKATINIIPCDIAAEIIYALSKDNRVNNVYHIVSLNDLRLRDVLKIAFSFYSMPIGRVVQPAVFIRSKLSPVKKRMWRPFLPYLRFYPRISSDMTRLKLKDYDIALPVIDAQYIQKILEYHDCNLFVKSDLIETKHKG